MEQEKQEAPVQQKKKRLSTPLLIFIILMAVTAVLCAIVAGIWLHGRSSLRNGGSAPTVTPGGTEQLDSYTVLHDGKYYRYKEHMVNLLLIGVDSDNKPAAPLPYGSDNQADVILVAALDTDANKMTLISVSGHHVRHRRAGRHRRNFRRGPHPAGPVLLQRRRPV